MDREQLALLKQIQELEFTAVEFNLYLDTHPADERALAGFTDTVRDLQQLTEKYTKKYAPLVAADVTGQSGWNWIDSPWPWEIDY